VDKYTKTLEGKKPLPPMKGSANKPKPEEEDDGA